MFTHKLALLCLVLFIALVLLLDNTEKTKELSPRDHYLRTFFRIENNSLAVDSVVVNGVTARGKGLSCQKLEFQAQLPNVSSYNGTIFIDWHLESDELSYINYKSLESLLVLYPQGKIQLIIVGPVNANYYKIGTIISKMVIQKYLKMGYQIEAQVVHQLQSLEQPVMPLNSSYWDYHFQQCCIFRSAQDISRQRVVPWHLYMYVRLALLFKHGGIYSDLSWLHRSDLRTGVNLLADSFAGYRFHNFRRSKKSNISLKAGFEGSAVLDRSVELSMVLVFSKHHPALGCLIGRFENMSDPMHSCLCGNRRDTCLRIAFKECFDRHDVTNRLDVLNVTTGLQQTVLDVRDQDPSDAAAYHSILFEDPTCESNFNSLLSLRDSVSRSALVHMGHTVYSADWQIPSSLSVFGKIFNASKLKYRAGVMVARARQNIVRRQNGVLKKIENGIRDKLKGEGKSRSEISQQIPRAKKYANQLLHSLGVTPTLFQEADQSSLSCFSSQTRSRSCSRYYGNSQYSSNFQRQANISCSPHFVLAGFMKAGSTFFFDTLVSHPQVLKTLKGVAFKETGCYLPDMTSTPFKAQQRMHCYPFVEEGTGIETNQPFVFGDGTAIYASRPHVPKVLLKDNPQIKILFSIRDPVDRSESHFRFSYMAYRSSGVPSINEIVERAFDERYTNLLRLYKIAHEAASIENAHTKQKLIKKLISTFQSGMKRDVASISDPQAQREKRIAWRCLNIIYHSLYFPAIYQWAVQFPKDNVMVVQAEDFKTSGLSLEQKVEAILRSDGHFEKRLKKSFKEGYAFYKKHFNQVDASASTSSGSTKANEQEKVGVEGEAGGDKILIFLNNSAAMIQNEYRTMIDSLYLASKFASVHRFLGLCPFHYQDDVLPHATNYQLVPKEHQLNQTIRAKLENFYKPFNMLLSFYLNTTLRYS